MLASVRIQGNPLREAVRLYFLPLSMVAQAFVSIARGGARIQDGQHRNRLLVRLLTSATRANKKAFLQYAFLVAEKHKKLKADFLSGQREAMTIVSDAKSLVDFLNRGFYESVADNFALLHDYFEHRRGVAPRFCVKANFKSHDHDGDSIVVLFRDGRVSYNSDTSIQQNTGFDVIAKTGRPFLENDIPSAYRAGRYVNPRLRPIAENALRWNRNWLRSGLAWKHFWVDWEPSRRNDRSFYKSTLIAPLTLAHAGLSKEFRRLVRLDDVDSAIFGYLCVDHIDTHYFDKELDVQVISFFADWLTMHAFTRMVYTDLSGTYDQVQRFLVEQDAELILDQVANLEDLVKKARARLVQTEEVTAVSASLDVEHPSTPTGTKLVPVDEQLLEMARKVRETAHG